MPMFLSWFFTNICVVTYGGPGIYPDILTVVQKCYFMKHIKESSDILKLNKSLQKLNPLNNTKGKNKPN